MAAMESADNTDRTSRDTVATVAPQLVQAFECVAAEFLEENNGPQLQIDFSECEHEVDVFLAFGALFKKKFDHSVLLSRFKAAQEDLKQKQAARVQVFEHIATELLEKNGEPHRKIDFSKCTNGFRAMYVFANALGESFDEKFDDDDVLSRFREAEETLDKKKKSTAPVVTRRLFGMEKSFHSQYIGTAHEDLYAHINACWTKLQSSAGGLYFYPYCAILQSSGFGKTRLLQQLAVHLETDQAVNAKGLHLLVYVNLRDAINWSYAVDDSTPDFPPKTPMLMNHFFPLYEKKHPDVLADKLAAQLVHLFRFVMQPESTRAPSAKPSIHAKGVAKLLQDLFSGDDQEFIEALQKFVAAKPSAKLQQATNTRRLLVFAVDGARLLLPKANGAHMDWSRILRRALDIANSEIANTSAYPRGSGIFGIVVDTDAKISKPEKYPGQRSIVGKMVDFPPFVLTHTTDVLHTIANTGSHADPDTAQTTLEAYQEEVIAALRALPYTRSSWRSLRKLGRPLWLKLDKAIRNNYCRLTELAGKKLLCGESPDDWINFNAETLNGVAAVLCRLGIRCRSSSPIARRLVADCMAVLSYVSHTQDQIVSSYSSDPILTLGSTRVWHGCPNMLATRMLPQLRKLLHQEALDTGDIGEVVARIVLLLAMDACGPLSNSTTTQGCYAAEFFSVWTLLTALQGCAPELRVVESDQQITMAKASDSDTKAAFEAVESHWKDWFVSFTHFIQLEEELSEACLWAMLGRRAAGIMPRGQNAVDLVIPICTIGASPSAGASAHVDGNVRVSMILVRVENPERSESPFPTCATTSMRPSEVFATTTLADEDATVKDTPLSETEQNKQAEKAKFAALAPDSVLRIYMDPRSETMERFYVEDKFGEDETSHVLCLKGLGPVSVQVSPLPSKEDVATHGVKVDSSASYWVDVQSQAVTEELQKLLQRWWEIETLVEQDVESRDENKPESAARFGMPKETLMRAAARPLAAALLFGSDGGERLALERSQLGWKASKSVGAAPSSGSGKRTLAVFQDGAEEETSTTWGGDAEEMKAAKKKKPHDQE